MAEGDTNPSYSHYLSDIVIGTSFAGLSSLKTDFYTTITFVSRILVHPIKSCRGTSVESSKYHERGLEHDRTFAIVDAQTHKVITAREIPKMVLVHPQIVVAASNAYEGRLLVSFPDVSDCQSFSIPLVPNAQTLALWERLGNVSLWGQHDIDGHVCQSIDDPQGNVPAITLSKYLERNVLLIVKGKKARHCPPTHDDPSLRADIHYQDGYPLLVASEESLLAVQTRMRLEVGKQGVADRWKDDELGMERFRPNIVIRGAGVPWTEDTWETIQIANNDSIIDLVSKCTRCLLPNVHPETGIRDKAVPFKILMKFRTGKHPVQKNKPCFGCNAVPSGSGNISVGDSVKILNFKSHT